MFLSQINVYPIKSLQGISLTQAEFDSRGLKFDRRWMLVDKNFRFLTQREYPKMAAIKTDILDDGLRVSFSGDELLISFFPRQLRKASVKIWQDKVEALVYEEQINRWFSDVIGVDCFLVRIFGSRKVDQKYAVSDSDEVAFADGYPFLLTNQASLRLLNKYASTPVDMSRFRANLVVEASVAFVEDRWKKIKIGDNIFRVVKPCSRCVITTIDQINGEKLNDEPLKTLSKIRRFRQEGENKILFGQNLISEQKSGSLKVGCQVEVLAEQALTKG
ncbi:MAG: MOSC domain-containing protein [Pyrinomonadaceae bacterium]|nr:MOSC domain-containing protein [Pyrinomonadaceae bacterium]MCX7639851.1 MOSC domain-containing protein [Pyrinomonadaceae bacterium]MDW8304023.1 MOSC domain-containing protein [Acidobacteriota bacterium]